MTYTTISATIDGDACLEYLAKLAGGLTSISLMDTLELTEGAVSSTKTDSDVDVDEDEIEVSVSFTVSALAGGHAYVLDLQNTDATPVEVITSSFGITLASPTFEYDATVNISIL